ncbi:MAG: HEAT repeat domain-containing protein [Pirellulaceae bacterium]
MSYSSGVEQHPHGAGKGKPDDMLPKVEPPGAGFIMQLFLIPMIIVLIIVVVWLMFSWLAHLGSDPRKLVEDISKGDKYGWQKASTLAELLRNREYEHLKSDKKLAGALAGTLTAQLDARERGQQDDENQRMLRMFICRALGEFYVDDGMPALVEAAAGGEESDIGVRRTAVESIAVLTRNVGSDRLRDKPSVVAALRQASLERPSSGVDENNAYADLRSTSAFALGVLGGDEALDRLTQLLTDSYANARYNAATGLARHGDVRSIPVILEMLDPDNEEAVALEESDVAIDWKRSLVQENGMKAVGLLHTANPQADYTQLVAALDRLSSSDAHSAIRQRAKFQADSLRGEAVPAATP